MKLREAVAKKLGMAQGDVTFADGMVSAGGRAVLLAEAAGAR
jgi:xanthine dehydrogenase YagR molybdenum-binding subunit